MAPVRRVPQLAVQLDWPSFPHQEVPVCLLGDTGVTVTFHGQTQETVLQVQL